MKITPHPHAPKTFEVRNGKEVYDVDLRVYNEPDCSCPSFTWRPHRPCKHILEAERFMRGEE